MNYQGINVLVCGMAKSGIAAARLLNNLGANVILQDLKKKEELSEACLLEKEGIQIYSGKNPDDIINKQDLIVLSPGVPCDLPFIMEAEKNSIKVISEVELAFSKTPCDVIAITGTNGKTTTTTLVGEILKRSNLGTKIVGNIGVPYSGIVQTLKKDDIIVAEISSFQMEHAITFKPKISAVLNISPDHLNRHKTMGNYVKMKERVLINQEPGDFCILNYEDEYCRSMAVKTRAHVFYFSSARVLNEGIYLENNRIILKYGSICVDLLGVNELIVLGIHNIENVMAAIAIAFFAETKLGIIIDVVKEFKAVEHRIEYVETIDGVEYYNDSKGTNTDASIRAVLAMKRPIVLIGGGYDKDSDFSDWVKTFEGRVKHAVLIGTTANKIKDAANAVGFTDITMCDNFKEAVDMCRNIAENGDCVLLSPACASWGMFKDYEERGNMFKKIVLEYK